MRRIASALVAACVLFFALPLLAESKPYHDGSVWELQCIHVKGGMEDRYARYLADDWKRALRGVPIVGSVGLVGLAQQTPDGTVNWLVIDWN